MSVIGGVESIQSSFRPVAGGRGDERIMLFIRHFATRCSGGGSGEGLVAQEADEERGRVA